MAIIGLCASLSLHAQEHNSNSQELVLDSLELPQIDEDPYYSEPVSIFQARLDSIKKTIPLPYNAYVQKYIDIYAARKDMMGKMLGMSTYYFPIFEKALKDLNMPDEIKYLPIIESSMNAHAVSRVGATGLWQFMFGTAKDYGLSMNNYIDERKDPIQASYAAAAYFRDAYNELGDWLLAVAAYNCGKGNVMKAINKANSYDFWEIRPYLPLETRNYVPAFIAAIYVMKYADKHDIVARPYLHAYQTDTIQVNRFVSLPQLAASIGVEEEVLTTLNPAYKRKIVHGTEAAPQRLVLPQTVDYSFSKIYDLLNEQNTAAESAIIAASNDDRRVTRRTASTALAASSTYQVKPGQNLSSISKNLGVSVAQLKAWNNLRSNQIQVGQTLKIAKQSGSATSKYLTYKVRSGDTLSEIASKFNGVTVQGIKRDNKLAHAKTLKPGMVLKIVRE